MAPVEGTPSFSALPHAILFDTSLSKGARLLYAVLQAHWWQSGACFASHETLAGELGCKDRQLRDYLGELLGAGYIVRRRRGRAMTNHYEPAMTGTPVPVKTRNDRRSSASQSAMIGAPVPPRSAPGRQDDRRQGASKEDPVKKKSPTEENAAAAGDKLSFTPTTHPRWNDIASFVSEWADTNTDDGVWPKWTPELAELIVQAIDDLGLEALSEACEWGAREGGKSLERVIKAAYSYRAGGSGLARRTNGNGSGALIDSTTGQPLSSDLLARIARRERGPGWDGAPFHAAPVHVEDFSV